jgi:hypothetical protein
MTNRDRRPASDERDDRIGTGASSELGLNRAGLGSPPANIDVSHRPDLFDINTAGLGTAGFGDDPGAAGGLGSGLGDTREAPFAFYPVGGAGVGAVSAEAVAEESAAEAEEPHTGTRAVGSVGSVSPQDTDDDVGGLAESDMGAISMDVSEHPGARLGETRGGHPGPPPRDE